MPDWLWIVIGLCFLYEKWGKLRVFDFARGLIHIEFAETKPGKKVKPASQRKRLAR